MNTKTTTITIIIIMNCRSLVCKKMYSAHFANRKKDVSVVKTECVKKRREKKSYSLNNHTMKVL